VWRSARNNGKGRVGAGFTLVEMVAVVAIVGVLASAAVPLGLWVHKRQRETELRLALRTIRNAIDAYKLAGEQGRIAMPADASGYPPTLQALVDGVPGTGPVEGRRVYLLRQLPRDPFAAPGLPAGQTWALRAYDSPPDAPRPGRDVYDVHSLSEGRALDGSLYREW
jgi:general secretion pathway protein G